MLVIFISWVCLGGSAYLWGMLTLKAFGKIEMLQRKRLIYTFLCGICMLTVYAQIYSLFGGVGMIALSGVLAADLIILICYRKEIIQDLLSLIKCAGIGRILTVLITGFLVLKISAELIYNPDTSLYHSQAIHWIEDYGAVKGLGNIHSRFAFNSSFLCLQALFSFRGFYFRSLHSVNGFLVWILISYALCSMKIWEQKKISVSDFLKICLLVFESVNAREFSSPGTDLFAHSLSIFIICEWVALLEENSEDTPVFALLSILCLYAFTLKLSSAVIILLAVLPAVRLVKARKWREIGWYLTAGFIVVIPFLIRNIMISGYLIYPFEKLDLFRVEWKMPKGVSAYERNRTKAWAEEIFGILHLNAPITEWFPYWFQAQSRQFIALLIADIIACITLAGYGIQCVKRRKGWEWIHLSFVLTACLIYWFKAAPHIRFGRPYILMPPFLVIGLFFSQFKGTKKGAAFALQLAVIGFCCKPVYSLWKFADSVIWYPISCVDYQQVSGTEKTIDGLSFYVPDDAEPDYYLFPALSDLSIGKTGLLGNDYSDGFKALSEG